MFITFEGIEGSGKTTQIRRLASWLRGRPPHYKVVQTREPGGTPFANRLRRLLLHPQTGRFITPSLELLLYQLARRDHVRRVIRPARAAGKTVLCDRFTDATLAYQGYGRGLSLEAIAWGNRLATGGLKPDLTILLDLPLEVGLRRSRNRLKIEKSKEGRFEEEALTFHQRVRNGYLALARSDKKRFWVVSANQNPDQVFAKIRCGLEKKR